MIQEVTVTKIYHVETERPDLAIASVVLEEMQLSDPKEAGLPEAKLKYNEPYIVKEIKDKGTG